MLFGAMTRSSVMSHYELRMNETLFADGSAKIVWIDLRRGKAKPLPDSIVALCAVRH
jgi:acyl-CoA thioester hydrolase